MGKNKYNELANMIINSMRNPQLENEELREWIDSSPQSKEMIDRLSSSNELEKACEIMRDFDEKKSVDKLLERIDNKRRTRRLNLIKSISSIAAAVVTVTFLLFNFYLNNEEETIAQVETINLDLDFSAPTLLTQDNTIELTDKSISAESEIVEGVKILENNKISYSNKSGNEDSKNINTLIVPKKYNYTVVLADGTEVMLNSGSRLEYPTKFSGDTREVKLQGEAFFKVKKDSKQFKVIADGVEIKVYGTRFNVKTLGDKNVEAVLVSGSTSVSIIGGEEMFMVPGNLASCNDENIIISEVDVDNYIQWIEGVFKYTDSPIETVMLDFSRWYGVDFICDDNVKDLPINFMLKKDISLLDNLNFIEKLGIVKFINEGGDKYRIVKY